MKQLVPTFCRKKPIWMAPDTAMVRTYKTQIVKDKILESQK